MVKGAAKAVVIKKKKWVPIIAPKLFEEQMIGESFVEEVQQLVGRVASVSLMALTGDPQKQSFTVSFRVIGVENDAAVTELVGYSLLPAAAKKLMRRRRSKIDDSFIVETGDKKILRIKPMIIARGHTTGSVVATMRKLERAFIAKMISQASLDDIVRDVVQRKLQSSLSQVLRKLYPVAVCEIRQFEVIAPEKVKELGLKITLPPEKLPEFKVREPKSKEHAKEQADGGEQSQESVPAASEETA